MFLYKTRSDRVFNLVLGGLVLYGLLLNILTTMFFGPLFSSVRPLPFLLGFLAMTIAGIACGRSSGFGMRLLGYHLLVLPFGPLLALILPEYAASEVFTAVVLTAVITVGMIGLSVVFPQFFSRLGRVLILSLLLTLAAEIAALLLGYRSPLLSWIGVGLFSMYIGYDWHRVQQGTKTVYHAIDCAVDLYLDITNLFLDLLDALDWSDLLG